MQMIKQVKWLGIVIVLAVLTSLWGCKKEKLLTTGGELRFSVDTLSFDTVFTTQGSFTLGLKIFNPQDQKVVISSIRTANGTSSYFHLNVDGHAGNEVNDIEVAAQDSIYVFATVNVDPTLANTPFVIQDQLIATLNGNDFSIPLIAYGQNAHFIVNNESFSGVLETDKPYVVIGTAIIEPGDTLTIPAGVHLYMHADARLLVAGTLHALGTKDEPVVFQGDRLDRDYFTYGGTDGAPGEWGGIYIDSKSTGNILSHTILKNCGNSTYLAGAGNFIAAAIQVNADSVADNIPQLEMDHSIIINSIGYGILSFGGNIVASNCQITDCGAEAVALVQGGNDTFTYCTIALYGSQKLSHIENPAVVALNYYKVSEGVYVFGDLNALFQNCIIFGSLDDEFVGDKWPSTSLAYHLAVKNCQVKANSGISGFADSTAGTSLNGDVRFVNAAKWDYHLTDSSAGTNAAVYIALYPDDLEGNARNNPPDAGCYEFH